MENIKIHSYPLKLKSSGDKKMVFDPVRNKYVVFTPEEFVRQNMILYLIVEKAYSKNLLAVEFPLRHMGASLRCDIVVFGKTAQPKIIIECKAPSVNLTQKTVDQIANYNGKLRVEYLVITNGKNTFCCNLNFTESNYKYIGEIPHSNLIDP